MGHASVGAAWALDSGFSPLTLCIQIGKLRSELEMVSGNVRVMSEMLTELVPTQIEPADLELLQVSQRPARRLGLHPAHPACTPALPCPHCSLLVWLGALRQ